MDQLTIETKMYEHRCKEGVFAEAPLLTDAAKLWLTDQLGKDLIITFRVVESTDG